MARSLCVFWKRHFENAMLTSCFTFATVRATDADVTFNDGPGMHTVKAAKQVYNSMWNALLKHGFVLVKTWLLIACGTGFYAIISFYLFVSPKERIQLVYTQLYQKYSLVMTKSASVVSSEMSLIVLWGSHSGLLVLIHTELRALRMF